MNVGAGYTLASGKQCKCEAAAVRTYAWYDGIIKVIGQYAGRRSSGGKYEADGTVFMTGDVFLRGKDYAQQ